MTVLSINLGRRVPLLGHEHTFVQHVVAPEHTADFDEAYPSMKGIRMVLLDKDRKPVSQAYLNPFTDDQDAKYETGRRSAAQAIYLLGCFHPNKDLRSGAACESEPYALHEVMTHRVFREIQKDHPDWLQYAPIDDDVQLQLRQLIYNNCGENSNITRNVIRMFSKMGTRGCDLWAYLLDHFGNEKPMQMLAMIEDLVRLQGGTTPLDVFIDDILQLKADIEDVLGDNPKELLSWFIFQKLYRHSDPILNKPMAKNVAVM